MESSEFSNNTSSLSSSSSRKRKGSENEETIPLKRAYFSLSSSSNIIHQRCVFRDSLMYYIIENLSGETYKKITKTCKYFFPKYPVRRTFLLVSIQVIVNRKFESEKWGTVFGRFRPDMTDIKFKIWITSVLKVSFYSFSNPTLLDSIIPKIYCCHAKTLIIHNQIFSFNGYRFLSSCAEIINFWNVTVKHRNGQNVVVECLVESAVKVKEFHYRSICAESNITSQTVQNLLKIPHFLELKEFGLYRIPEKFDFELLITYLKKNKNTMFWLVFVNSIPQTYKNQIETFMDQILVTQNRDYMIPSFWFPDINRIKVRQLLDLSILEARNH